MATNPDRRLSVDDSAPDVSVALPTGETIALASLWSEKPAVLLFLRHFG